jgi:subtilisin family serine protease
MWVRSSLEELASTDLKPVDVAVLDTGIDATHPDLAGRISDAYRITENDGQFLVLKKPPNQNSDSVGHGTGVASVIARLAPNARIVDIGVLGDVSKGTGAAVLAGLKLALDLHVRVINISLALKTTYAAQLWPLSELAYRQNQIIVAARRNMPLVESGFPAEFSSCLGVDREAFRTPYTIRFRSGDFIEYSAHGEEVVVASAGGGYTIKTGTSFAAPAVSAFCSLLLGSFPDLRLFELKTILKAFSI